MRTALAIAALALAALALPLVMARAESRTVTGFERAGELATILQALPGGVAIQSLDNGVKLSLSRVQCKEYGVGTMDPLPVRHVRCVIEAMGKRRTALGALASITLIDTLARMGIVEAGALGRVILETGKLECLLKTATELQHTPVCIVDADWAE